MTVAQQHRGRFCVFVSDELKKAMAEITEAYYTIKTGDGSLS